jgi:RNA polymerase sigma-70 factor, ECF subfamily
MAQTNTGSPADLVVAIGHSTWPGIVVDEDQVRGHLERLEVSATEVELRARDLFLAAACATGARGAIEVFEREVLPVVDLAVRRFSLDRATVAEVKQRVRVKLFCGDNPRIEGYRGRGSLDSWVRMLAVRTALDLLDGARAPGAAEMQALPDIVSDDDNPEVAIIAARDRTVFQGALERAFESLAAREKTILRLYFVDELGVEGIGAIYQVHKATVSRWLLAIRTKVVEELHRILSVDLRLSPSELRSLTALCWNQVRLSASRILGVSGRTV